MPLPQKTPYLYLFRHHHLNCFGQNFDQLPASTGQISVFFQDQEQWFTDLPFYWTNFEQQVFQRLTCTKRKSSWLASRWLLTMALYDCLQLSPQFYLRSLVGKKMVITNHCGDLLPCSISLTHSQQVVAVLLMECDEPQQQVGLDIEVMRTRKYQAAIARRYFEQPAQHWSAWLANFLSGPWLAVLEKKHQITQQQAIELVRFHLLWVMYEAYIKKTQTTKPPQQWLFYAEKAHPFFPNSHNWLCCQPKHWAKFWLKNTHCKPKPPATTAHCLASECLYYTFIAQTPQADFFALAVCLSSQKTMPNIHLRCQADEQVLFGFCFLSD